MIKFDTYVNASEIWPTAKDHEDKGLVPGLVRGYNIEVAHIDGHKFWTSCEYIHGEPEKRYNDRFHVWMYGDHGWTPTGRICFRGYGIEEYSVEYDDEIVIPCDEKGNVIEEG